MTSSDLARFAALATLWSLQFIFMRVAVPAFGAPLVADGRAIFGALVVVPAALFLAQRIALRAPSETSRHMKYLLVALVVVAIAGVEVFHAFAADDTSGILACAAPESKVEATRPA